MQNKIKLQPHQSLEFCFCLHLSSHCRRSATKTKQNSRLTRAYTFIFFASSHRGPCAERIQTNQGLEFALIAALPAVCKNNNTPDSPELRDLFFLHLSSLGLRCAKRIKLQDHKSLEFYSVCTDRRSAVCVRKEKTSRLARAQSFYSFCIYRRSAGNVQK